MYDYRGYVSATGANMFFVKDGASTRRCPTASSTASRQSVIALARSLQIG